MADLNIKSGVWWEGSRAAFPPGGQGSMAGLRLGFLAARVGRQLGGGVVRKGRNCSFTQHHPSAKVRHVHFFTEIHWRFI